MHPQSMRDSLKKERKKNIQFHLLYLKFPGQNQADGYRIVLKVRDVIRGRGAGASIMESACGKTDGTQTYRLRKGNQSGAEKHTFPSQVCHGWFVVYQELVGGEFSPWLKATIWRIKDMHNTQPTLGVANMQNIQDTMAFYRFIENYLQEKESDSITKLIKVIPHVQVK